MYEGLYSIQSTNSISSIFTMYLFYLSYRMLLFCECACAFVSRYFLYYIYCQLCVYIINVGYYSQHAPLLHPRALPPRDPVNNTNERKIKVYPTAYSFNHLFLLPVRISHCERTHAHTLTNGKRFFTLYATPYLSFVFNILGYCRGAANTTATPPPNTDAHDTTVRRNNIKYNTSGFIRVYNVLCCTYIHTIFCFDVYVVLRLQYVDISHIVYRYSGKIKIGNERERE